MDLSCHGLYFPTWNITDHVLKMSRGVPHSLPVSLSKTADWTRIMRHPVIFMYNEACLQVLECLPGVGDQWADLYLVQRLQSVNRMLSFYLLFDILINLYINQPTNE